MQAGQAKIPPWLSFTWHHPLGGIWRTVCEDGLHSQASVPVAFYSDVNHASVLWGCFSEKGNIWGSPETTLP